MKQCPHYLKDYADLWTTDPRSANLAWFCEARYGLFLHYGLYSQLERGEWVMHDERIPVAEYEQHFDSFDPSGFDADAITDLALDAGMRYVNLTTCHHEGFCLWDSTTEPFNARQAAGRDLVKELGEACDRKGLGFFCYFTYVLNWRHPHSIPAEHIWMCRPGYPTPEPRYKASSPDECGLFWQWAHDCIGELCSQSFPVAGIWLDLIGAYYMRPELVPVEETYALIRELAPEALLSFKLGATGTEDFAAPEFHLKSRGDRLRRRGNVRGADIADSAWNANKDKHNEICMTLQDDGWGWNRASSHKGPDEIWGNLAYAGANNCNLLVNTGPLPDGSLHADDVETLRELGQRIREHGYPSSEDGIAPSREEAAQAE